MSNGISLRTTAALISLILIGCGGARKSVTVEPEQPGAEPQFLFGIVAEVASGPQQLTFEACNNGIGAYHPGGERIVFQSDRDGRWQIYELNPTDGRSQRLISSPSNDENPVWMPDSSGILFVSDRNSGGREYGRDIFFYDPASVLTATLADDAADDWYPVPVSADEYLFLSERGTPEGTPDYLAVNGLYRGHLSGEPPMRVGAADLDPSAPADIGDGRQLVRTAAGRLAILNSGDGGLELLTPPSLHCGTAAYSQSRRIAVFSAREGEIYQLYLIDLATRTAQKLETGDGEVRYPQISPDGNRILFAKEVEGYFQLFQMELAQ